MGCDRVVIVSTSTLGDKTSVGWLAFELAGLTGYLVTFVHDGVPTSFEADAAAKSLTATYTPEQGTTVTVTPQTAEGPVNDKASFRAPIPFPPPPIDPDAGRPIVLRACADGTSVTVNWKPSTKEGVRGNYLTITQNKSKLTNFPIDGGEVATATVDYKIEAGSSYEVSLTPYDAFGPDYQATSYPAPIPYP
jgi:hypothetical protein